MSWQDWGAIAAAVAALGSLAAAFFSYLQVRAANNQAALTWLYDYLSERTKRDDALGSAPNDEAEQAAFVDTLNFLEATTLAYSLDIIPYGIRPQIFNDICKHIATIEGSHLNDKFKEYLARELGLRNTKGFLRLHARVIARTKQQLVKDGPA